MPAPPIILDLIARFERNIDAYKSGFYNETQVRREFIDPFFEAMGWDVNNTQGNAEAYKDVIHEDAVKVGGISKAPDYSFRIGGQRKFFVEAKKPSVNIKDTPTPAYQVRRYAWSAKLPLSIVTDFEEFAVYDCRIKPDQNDNASKARIKYYTWRQYAEKFDEIAGIFGKDAILKGSFDKYAESNKAKRGTAEVDSAFLKEIESWRDMLAKNIALRNTLSVRELNDSVQRTIDRIIFLRIAEDRGIEEYGSLRGLGNGQNTYARLQELFYQADDRYNSGLFHFRHERDEAEPPDNLTMALKIDDRPLKDILKRLYYPESPYEFSVLPADILGQVYEQFLGKVIRLTGDHRAVVEDKPEVKKAGGVFYTPTYIVDYIVKNTVGKLLDGKTPKKAESLRILDPACGSGSFLIGAYQHLLNWHLKWYAENNPDKHAKAKKPTLYKGAGDAWHLTTAERKRILLNNIYGVDIDSQAVEVTKLSLLLKVLEGETGESLNQQIKLFHERALPNLGGNIKCGNSLIGPDFYDGRQMSMLDDEERLRVNVFDWRTEFPEIFESGGFDAVIGNPPYVRQEMLGNFKEYFQTHYEVFNGTADLYVYFIERSLSLLREHGIFSFIVANKWMRAKYGAALRKWLKFRDIEEIVDFGDLPVFQKATTYPCIIRMVKNKPEKSVNVTVVKTLDFHDLQEYVTEKQYAVEQMRLDDRGWSLSDGRTQELFGKIKKAGVPLAEYINGGIYYGIKTGLNEAFVIDAETRSRLIAEDKKSEEIIKPFLTGRDIKRYQQPSESKYLILIPKGWTRNISHSVSDAWGWLKKQYPAISNHLSPFADKAKKRYDKGEYWWELRTCDYYSAFEKPKIIIPAIVQRASYNFDDSGFYSNDKTSIIPTKDFFLLGVLNSRLADFFIHSISSTKQGGYFEYKPMYVQQIPIKDGENNNQRSQIENLVRQMLILNKQLPEAKTSHEHTLIQRQIDATDRQIDKLVYELYGLTPEEIAIVEGK